MTTSTDAVLHAATQRRRLEAVRRLAPGAGGLARLLALLDAEERPPGRPPAAWGRLEAPRRAWSFDDRDIYPQGPRLPTGAPVYAFSTLSGTRVPRPYHGDYDQVAIAILAEALRETAFDAVVELGADCGQRLGRLFLAGAPAGIPYFAAEPGEAGRAAAVLLRQAAPGWDLRPVPFELETAGLPFLAGFKRVLLFTHGYLSAEPALPPDLFARLAAAAPSVTAYHFEVIGHQVKPDGWLAHRAVERRLNGDFVARLLDAHRSGKIQADFLAADIYDLSVLYPVSIAIWRAVS